MGVACPDCPRAPRWDEDLLRRRDGAGARRPGLGRDDMKLAEADLEMRVRIALLSSYCEPARIAMDWLAPI